MSIEQNLSDLSVKNPIFRLEKDFQYVLCQEFESKGYRCSKNGFLNGEKVDLLVEDKATGKRYAIHLRNKTAKLSAVINGEEYNLKNHGAQDLGRYDFLKDVASLERLTKGRDDIEGYAILLTNDHLYWTKPKKMDSVDRDFLLFDGRKVTGELKWSSQASLGTRENREDSIILRKEYTCSWNQYSHVSSEQKGTFEYLLIKIG